MGALRPHSHLGENVRELLDIRTPQQSAQDLRQRVHELNQNKRGDFYSLLPVYCERNPVVYYYLVKEYETKSYRY